MSAFDARSLDAALTTPSLDVSAVAGVETKSREQGDGGGPRRDRGRTIRVHAYPHIGIDRHELVVKHETSCDDRRYEEVREHQSLERTAAECRQHVPHTTVYALVQVPLCRGVIELARRVDAATALDAIVVYAVDAVHAVGGDARVTGDV